MIPFRECWACDFEFRADRGERPWPVCMVARELHTGREIRMWRGELTTLRCAPFNTVWTLQGKNTGRDSLDILCRG